MTKIGVISTYQRILYSSAVKREFYTPSSSSKRALSTSAAVRSDSGDSKKNEENLQKPKEDKTFNIKTGDIGDKLQHNNLDKLKSLNIEDAKKIALEQYELQRKVLEDKLESVRIIFGGSGRQPRTADEEWYAKRVSYHMKRYEDFVGLTEVKGAQARVVECERKFIEMQDLRREAQSKITDIQKKIKDIHLELEKTHRGEDRYLILVTQEHQVLKDEKQFQDEFKHYEKIERECFSALSNAVRDSHEKERAQAEKTKYWSVLGSIIGTCLGILGTTINNRMRMNELRKLVSQNNTVEEIRAIGDQLQEDFSSHRTSLAGLVSSVENVVGKADHSVDNLERMSELCDIMKESSDKINVRGIDKSIEELRQQQESLNGVISSHRDQVDAKIQELLEDIFSQRQQLQVINAAAVKDREKDIKLHEKREAELKATSESMSQQSSALRETMLNSVKSIDEKMKDVRSLLLHQSQVPKETEKWIEKLERVEKTQMLLLQKGFDNVNRKLDEAAESRRHTLSALRGQYRSDTAELQVMELDNMSVMMAEHQRKTQHAVVMTGLVVGVMTPVVMYAVNKLL